MSDLALEEYLEYRYSLKGYLFIPYLAVPFPDWDTSLVLAKTLFEEGADAIEIGIPFTDPVADGVVLQTVFQEILATYIFQWEHIFHFVIRLYEAFPDRAILFMGYANVFWQYGMDKLLTKLGSMGVKGVIIPDLPFAEAKKYNDNIPIIQFIALTTPKERIQQIASHARGFIYLVATKGVTGQSQHNIVKIHKIVRTIKCHSSLPVLVGFGVDSRSKTEQLLKIADGFIVGSALHENILTFMQKINHYHIKGCLIKPYIRTRLRRNLRKMVQGLLPSIK